MAYSRKLRQLAMWITQEFEEIRARRVGPNALLQIVHGVGAKWIVSENCESVARWTAWACRGDKVCIMLLERWWCWTRNIVTESLQWNKVHGSRMLRSLDCRGGESCEARWMAPHVSITGPGQVNAFRMLRGESSHKVSWDGVKKLGLMDGLMKHWRWSLKYGRSWMSSSEEKNIAVPRWTIK